MRTAHSLVDCWLHTNPPPVALSALSCIVKLPLALHAANLHTKFHCMGPCNMGSTQLTVDENPKHADMHTLHCVYPNLFPAKMSHQAMFSNGGDAAGLPGCENVLKCAACGGTGVLMVHRGNATVDGVV